MDKQIRKAVRLAGKNMSYRRIATEVGLDESTIRRHPDVRAARLAANPEAHSSASIVTLACQVRPASELISRVDRHLEDLTDSGYTLAYRERRRLAEILENALNNLRR